MQIQLKKHHGRYSNYKQTGIPWLGEVPEEWEISKVKQLTKIFNGATPKSAVEDYWDGNIPWFTPADISKEEKYLGEPKRMITKIGYESCGTNLVKAGSILISNRAPIGLVAIGKTPFCANQGCKSLQVKRNYSSDYLYYLLYSFSSVLDSLGNGSTFKE